MAVRRQVRGRVHRESNGGQGQLLGVFRLNKQGPSHGSTNESTKENSSREKCTESEYTFGLMEKSTKASTTRGKSMAMAFTPGQTGESTREAGKTACRTEQGSSGSTRKVSQEEEFGRKANSLLGSMKTKAQLQNLSKNTAAQRILLGSRDKQDQFIFLKDFLK